MEKNSVLWFLGLSAYIALGLFGFALYPSVVHIHFYFSCIVICAVVDGIAFFVCCAILRKFGEFAFWKFAVYLILIAAPSLVIASLTTELSHPFNYSVARQFVLCPHITLNLHSFLFFCAFILFASLNFLLWRFLFSVTIRQVVGVSVSLALINTIICWISTPIFN
jgi:hypothetical protein